MARWCRTVLGLVEVDVVVAGPMGFSTIRVHPAWRKRRTPPNAADTGAAPRDEPGRR